MVEPLYRVLVTGASGMLGKDVTSALNLVQGWDVHSLVRAEVPFLPGKQVVADLEDSSVVVAVMREVQPDCIVHCAALTDLERCERDRAAAYRINVEAVTLLVGSMPQNGRFLYISTDSVFDGQRSSYLEDDVPNPLNYYAETKLMGESAALKMDGSALVLRTNLYGFHLSSHGRSLVEWAHNNISRGQTIKGFDDVYFNPLYTKQLAELIARLIPRRDISGFLNLGASEQVSKFEFLQRVAGAFGYSRSLIQQVDSHEMQFSVKRPANTTLDCSRLRQLVGKVPSLAEGLMQLAEDFAANLGRGDK